MAYIQRNVPAVNRLLEFHIKDFSGGMNNQSTLTQPNEASDVRNVTFYDKVVVEKRVGSEVFGTYKHSEPVLFLGEFQPYTEENQIVRAGANKLTLDAGGVLTDIALSNQGMDAENFLGKYFFADGNMLRVYGKFPTVSDTYTRVVGTNTGEYKTLRVVSTPATYTPLGVEYVRGVTVYDYNTNQVWYEPCENEKKDPYLGVSVVPEFPRYLASLHGRLYVSGNKKDNDNVFLTQAGNPFYFPPSLPLQVPPNSDLVVGLAVYDNAVFVGRKNDIHVITGMTNNPELGMELFEIRKMNAHTGFLNNKSVNVAHNYLFFMGNDGNAYALSSARQDTKVLSTSLLNRKLDMLSAPFNLERADLSEAVSFFYNGVWYVSVLGFVFCYHYEQQAWLVWDGLDIRSFYVLNDEFIWGDEHGDTCTFTKNYLDKGVPFKSYWISGDMDMGDTSSYKFFRDVYLVAQTFASFDSDLKVGFELDYTRVNGNMSIPSSSARWGISRFGDKFGVKGVNSSLPFTIGRRARTMKVILENGVHVLSTFPDNNSLPTEGMQNGDCYYVTDEDAYYVWNSELSGWDTRTLTQVNQPMRVYQINGEYELRGKR